MSKAISFFLAVVFLVCVGMPDSPAKASAPESAFLTGDSTIVEERASFESDRQAVLERTDLTTEQKARFLAKIDETEKIMNGAPQEQKAMAGALAASSYNIYNCTMAVPFYKQETRYFCGPATARQTIAYIKGSALSQSTLASIMGTTSSNGTDGSRVVSCINAYQTRYLYQRLYPTSESSMITVAGKAINTWAAPPILHVKMDAGWPYTSKGHYMNISGIKKSGSRVMFEVTDPYYTWVYPSAVSGKYPIFSTIAYNSTRAHPAGEFIC